MALPILKILAIVSLLISIFYVQKLWFLSITILLAIAVSAEIYFNHLYTYWERLGVPSIPAVYFFGSMKDLAFQNTSLTEIMRDFYVKTGNMKYAGFYAFLQPQLLIKDLDIIKTILVKEFSNFADRGIYVNTEKDPLTGNLFSLDGQRWKTLRAKITPTFTSGKLKAMFSTVRSVAHDWIDYSVNLNSETVEIKDLTSRYGLDVISNVALGIEGNNFKDDNTDMKRITKMVTSPSRLDALRSLYHFFFRDIPESLRMRSIPKKVEDYFYHITKNTIDYRKANNVHRNDFLQLLMCLGEDSKITSGAPIDTKNQGQISLSIWEMAAQSFIFVVAGFETTSVTLCFLLYEMAVHQDMQKRLINELDSIGPDAQYEDLLKLPYLEMVISETLRKHPPIPIIQRESAKDYEMPDGKIIKARTVCVIPVFALHRDPELFPDPEKFDPERFNKDNIKNIKPYSFLPFGEGPRVCIGNRFAMMQLKLAIASLFSQFNVMISDKTPMPVKIDKKAFVYNAEGGLWLRLVNRNK